MATAILTVGILFSGKSAFAERVVRDDPSYVIISRDDYALYRGDVFSQILKGTINETNA